MVGLIKAFLEALKNGNSFYPSFSVSKKYKHWVSIEDARRCLECKTNHGKIWRNIDYPSPIPPLHSNCRCLVEAMISIKAGTATINKKGGADWWLKHNRKLPDYYVDISEAKNAGWIMGKSLSNYIPGKMITCGIFKNNNGHLPSAQGRIWYEADINYTSGKRNAQRIVWSNDGLIFVTYDHYSTFFEIE